MSCNQTLTIGHIAQVFDGPHATPKKIEAGPYFLSISSLENGKLDLSKSAHVSDEDFKKWTRRVTPEEGDILFSYETRLGEVAMMPAGITACLGRRMGLLRPDRSKILPEYLLYAYQSPAFQETIRSKTIHGATVDRIALKELPSFQIQVPPLSVQEKIVNVLKGYDRKLMLNSETNQTLEQMAQAIFKSWFVDFDPVKAKMNGELPKGMDAATASLFPEKLVESELGLIPEGWEASCMGEHFNITMGQSPKGETYNEEGEGIAFFQGRRDFGFRYPDVRVFTTDPKRYAKAGDTLISVRAPVGDKNMAAIDCCIGRGVAAIKHNSDSRSFTYAFMSHIEKKLGDSGSSGTVFSSINQKELKKVSFVAPPPELIEAFHKLLDPIDQKVEVLSGEIESLSSLRDTLLPKLLSGEINLDTTEELVEVN
ncbi:hypothetical protein OAS_00485 [Vibrio cyclitrophicus ZF65]|uniref:restriction endonuclease subunit S n=1 Tax=Vibrio cyclitrophicus TaxID=47951 RepID=UPI00031276C2|nr:restriction endonuclease subunit S [Vibrio cyclitrophicus]OED78004.1 hypothetical protein OAS_00485 [Vibrio cyclitrophicus ZF65]